MINSHIVTQINRDINRPDYSDKSIEDAYYKRSQGLSFPKWFRGETLTGIWLIFRRGLKTAAHHRTIQ